MNLGNVIEGKKVKIKEKCFSGSAGETYKGTVDRICYSSKEAFIKLSEGTIVNVRYIASIEIIE